MNSQGWIRGMMSKSYDTEQFIIHVVSTICRQLTLWNKHYDVKLLQDLTERNMYYVVVSVSDDTYKVSLSESDVKKLQDKWPYALDQHIWRALMQGGLTIQRSDGNYLTYCAI